MFFPVYFGDSLAAQVVNLQSFRFERSELAIKSLMDLATRAKMSDQHPVFILSGVDTADEELPRRNTVVVLRRLSSAQIDAAKLMVAYWAPEALGRDEGKLFSGSLVSAWDSLRVSVEQFEAVEAFLTNDPVMVHATWEDLVQAWQRGECGSPGVSTSTGDEQSEGAGVRELSEEAQQFQKRLFDLFHEFIRAGTDVGRCAKNLLASTKHRFFAHALEVMSTSVVELQANYDTTYESWAVAPSRDAARVKSVILKNKKHKNINPAIEKCRRIKVEIEECQLWQHLGSEATAKLSKAYADLEQASGHAEKFVSVAGVLNTLVKKAGSLQQEALETAKAELLEALRQQEKLHLISDELMEELHGLQSCCGPKGKGEAGKKTKANAQAAE